ncbi:GLPGLI family protein [Thermoflavifilum aggregans]|uniref:GLPGLI family protein n=1 Tax=Thermoflavifilum aggregans TaxID=454188 RepID=A0A2M9CWD1_9BACT|nr:hypothetical protein [Thermoflavifilum aggregans]PJJ76214.1 GLPGLI family protein [Thermoflavifilum aggregans]
MKNLLFLFTLLSVQVFCLNAFSQKVFTDGTIYYSVNVDAPANNQQLANTFQGSTYTLYVKGKWRRIDMDLKMMKQQIYINTQDSTFTFLIETMGNKYMMKLNAEQLRKRPNPYRGITFTDTIGSKNIAGYPCKLAIAHLPDGTTFPVYYTTQLMPEGEYSADQMFAGLKGFPLEYQLTIQNLKMTITAEKIDLTPLPMSTFDIPRSGYREVNPDEFMQ